MIILAKKKSVSEHECGFVKATRGEGGWKCVVERGDEEVFMFILSHLANGLVEL